MSSKIKENISLEFDAFSENYTQDMIHLVPHYEQLMSCFSHCLPIDFNPQRILDLGCGNGNTTAELIKRFPKAKYDLLDASPQMLSICKSRFSAYDIITKQSYFSDFTFPQLSYDLIIAGFSLHHCKADEKQLLFKRMRSSLTQGGFVSMSDLFITKTDEDHPRLLEDWQTFVSEKDLTGEKWVWLQEHYEAFDNPHNFKSQKNWLLEAGFTNVEIGWKKGHWMHVLANS